MWQEFLQMSDDMSVTQPRLFSFDTISIVLLNSIVNENIH
ncbi:hypothetical protein HMPREF3205_02181 [Streptococcus pasteurianus]|nr:hypothetical protein HMPREF3205_02181 [Streptococcus pasteurianus]